MAEQDDGDRRPRVSSEELDPQRLIEVIALLRPLSDAARVRIVDAALVFLDSTRVVESAAPRRRSSAEGDAGGMQTNSDLPRRAQIWVGQNNLSSELIDSVFHRSPAGVELIVNTLPGRTNKDRVIQGYLLCGARSLVESGEPRFADDDAREFCRLLGFYDRDNHATYMKALGNLVVGSKSAGFELTQPGMRAAADLIRSLGAKP